MGAMMDSSPSKTNARSPLPSLSNTSTTAGQKRAAPTLLPAFEPFSSSPGFPRPSKRARTLDDHSYEKYPTPIPTSTTGILSSSPPQVQSRPRLQRISSVISERAPLSSVPSIALSENGDIIRMGRSSNSSHYQLSANRLISRVHVEARYIAASMPLEEDKVEIVCKGWNGIKLHCGGRTWEMAKNDTFTSETAAEIMLDVQDARVRIEWPNRERKLSVDTWDDENSPSGRHSAVNARGQVIESSPLRNSQRFESPVSPTPARAPANLAGLFSDDAEPVVQVYEDSPSPKENVPIVEDESFVSTQAATSFAQLETQSSDLSEAEKDPDEENDPVVHSFGPFGANISDRMASFTTLASPEVPRREATPPPVRSSSASTNEAELAPIVNHIVNQLAFSRIASTPLSVILNNLPAELRNPNPDGEENKGLSKDDLRKLINATSCIGEIHREGKDAAGKQLESEYYYIPDEDQDEQRRAAVVDGLRKPSLRNCRKSHKQYYWKRPRTP